MSTPSLPASAEVLLSLTTALALGFLVGLQREWLRCQVAGIRAFALPTTFGALFGLIGLAFGGWVIASGFLPLAAMVILGNLSERKQPDPDIGLTTEMAKLVMFAVGIVIMLGHRLEATAVAGVVMVLLHSKKMAAGDGVSHRRGRLARNRAAGAGGPGDPARAAETRDGLPGPAQSLCHRADDRADRVCIGLAGY